MILNLSDKVSFRRYAHNFELFREKCDCGAKFDNVMLDRSDSQTLQVCCSNENCLQFTLATRIAHRPTLKLQLV